MSGHLLGLDVGHTLIKAVVFDARGRPIGGSSRPVEVSRPHPYWQERDLEETWRTVAAAIADALADAGLPAAAVRAVGLAGHGDGLYLVDDRLRPVRPAILATDSRADGYRAGWKNGASAERLLALTGQLPEPYAPACLLSWLRDREPESLRRTAYVLFCKDWIRLQLTGVVATDPTDAAAGLCDIRTRQWSAEALEIYGLPECGGLLPPIRPAVDWVRGITGLTQEPVSTVVARALAQPIDADDPMFLPYVHGGRLDPSVGGSFLGLGGWQHSDDLIRAALEGVAYEHRLQLTALAPLDQAQVGAVRLTGGGSRSTAWSQLLADVTGFRIEITDTHEAGARGAAMLAGIGVGLLSDPLEASRRWV